MTKSGQYSFRKVTLDDLPLLATWQSAPHIRQWWESAEPYSAADLADPKVSRWIVSNDDHPFAFMQDYAVHGWENHHFDWLPKGSRGIDQYIGDPEMTGKGHGPAFIKARMNALFEAGTPVIATDPHPENTRAIAVYKKLRFEPSGPPEMTRWGLILPMLAKR